MDAGEFHGRNSRCFHSSLARFPYLLNNYFRVPQATSMQCYITTCTGPTELKVSVENVWYDCPYEGGEIYPIDFGGSITCRPRVADVMCVNAQQDDEWPLVTKIVPRTARPGDNVTVYGTNFKINDTTLLIYDECTNLEVISSNIMTANLPTQDKFSGIAALGLFFRRFGVIVSDKKGRNSHLKEGIQIQIQDNGASVHSFFAHRGINPIVMAVVALVLLLLGCLGCTYWSFRTCKNYEKQYVYTTVNFR